MSFKYWMLCIVLFIIILLLAVKSYDALTHPLKLMPDRGAAKKSQARTENFQAMGVVTKPASTAPYNLIAEKNIFSPVRKDFQGTGPGSTLNTAIRPQIILYGVTIARNYQSALLVNPGRSLKKGERDSMTLKLGERIGEYKLAKVLSDRITLEAQGDAFEVLLYDPKAPKKRESGPSPGVPSSAFTPTGTPGPSVRMEATKSAKGPVQERTSRSQMPMPVTPNLDPSQIPSPIPTPIPGSAAAPTQIPAPMGPTPIVPPLTPTPVTVPPGMGQPIPLLPGGPMQPPPSSGR